MGRAGIEYVGGVWKAIEWAGSKQGGIDIAGGVDWASV